LKNGILTARSRQNLFPSFCLFSKKSSVLFADPRVTRVLFLSMLFNFQGPCRRLTVKFILSHTHAFVKRVFFGFCDRKSHLSARRLAKYSICRQKSQRLSPNFFTEKTVLSILYGMRRQSVPNCRNAHSNFHKTHGAVTVRVPQRCRSKRSGMCVWQDRSSETRARFPAPSR